MAPLEQRGRAVQGRDVYVRPFSALGGALTVLACLARGVSFSQCRVLACAW